MATRKTHSAAAVEDGDRTRAAERERELATGYRGRRVARYRSLVLHWLGRMVRRPARAAAAPLPAVRPGQVAITFAGHATALIRYAELSVVCDPMLGRWVGAAHREIEPGLSPAELIDVDLILITHAHPDHLHRPTLELMPRSATVVVPPRTAQLVSDLGFARVVELGIGESVQYRGVDIFTAAVRHGRDVQAMSFVLRGDGPSIYFCGDSGYFSGFSAIGKLFQPDIALLPIGGYAPASFRDRHMTPLDAVQAFEDLGARIMIPIHYGSFALSYEQIGEPARWLAEVIHTRDLQDYVYELAPGESRVFVPPNAGERHESHEGNEPTDAPANASTPSSTEAASPTTSRTHGFATAAALPGDEPELGAIEIAIDDPTPAPGIDGRAVGPALAAIDAPIALPRPEPARDDRFGTDENPAESAAAAAL